MWEGLNADLTGVAIAELTRGVTDLYRDAKVFVPVDLVATSESVLKTV